MPSRYAPRTGKFDRVMLAALCLAIVVGGMTSLWHWAAYAVDLPQCATVAATATPSEASAPVCTDVMQLASAG